MPRRLMIRCPNTYQLIHTGISMDEAWFQDPTNDLRNNTTSCPYCHAIHPWKKADAVLEPASLAR